MANKVAKFFKEKVLTFVIQFTIGLIMPWWLIDKINSSLVQGYSSKFKKYNKILRYSFGLILPWWILFLLQGNKMQTDKQSKTSDTGAEKQKEHEQKTKEKNYYCRRCNKHVVSKKHPRKVGSPLDDRCSASKSSNSSHDWTDMGYVGDYKSTCKHCGLTIWHEKQFLHSMLCPKRSGGLSHDWKPLN